MHSCVPCDVVHVSVCLAVQVVVLSTRVRWQQNDFPILLNQQYLQGKMLMQHTNFKETHSNKEGVKLSHVWESSVRDKKAHKLQLKYLYYHNYTLHTGTV